MPASSALPAEEAGRRIRAEAGKQFDPAAVDAFDSCEQELARIWHTHIPTPRHGQ
ncbi:MAG: hypothetical protein Q7R30_03535 [Acidobacteriota bacterium]|nr:hypothetical protein [Acidobacteriota bacterium]